MRQLEYQCTACGEIHVGLPALHTSAPMAVRDVPEHEQADRVHLDPVACVCVIDDARFFMQSQLHFDVDGVDEDLVYSVWAELEPGDFRFQAEHWGDPRRADVPELEVRLHVWLPAWPEVNTTGRLKIQPPGSKPILTLTGDDAMSLAQSSGLTQEQAAQAAIIALHGAPPTRRPVEDLRSVPDPSWPLIQDWVRASPHSVEVLPIDEATGLASLELLQVSARSGLGGLGLNCGGLRISNGWLWILGGGLPGVGLSNLIDANGLDQTPTAAAIRGFMVCAYDALGGVFAINGGSLPGRAGEVNYREPGFSSWEPLDLGHAAFVETVLKMDLARFYDAIPLGLAEAASKLALGQALSIYPFPGTAGDPLEKRHRRAVPMRELFELYGS